MNNIILLQEVKNSIVSKYNKLLKNKNIKNKLQLSIKEFRMGLEMLKCKNTEIDSNNVKYVNLLMEFLHLEDDEQKLDKAL